MLDPTSGGDPIVNTHSLNKFSASECRFASILVLSETTTQFILRESSTEKKRCSKHVHFCLSPHISKSLDILTDAEIIRVEEYTKFSRRGAYCPPADEVTGRKISLMTDNSTVVAYIKKQGGLRSHLLQDLTEEVLTWAKGNGTTLTARFILGKRNVVADGLSRRGQVLGTEWSLHPEVARSVLVRWGVSLPGPLCNQAERQTASVLLPSPGSSSNHGRRLSTSIGRPGCLRVPSVRAPAADPKQTKDLQRGSADSNHPLVAGKGVVPRPTIPSTGPAVAPSHQRRSSQAASFSEISRRARKPIPSRVEVIKRLLTREGFSTRAASQMTGCLRSSSRAIYQAKWLEFYKWCRKNDCKPIGASIPTIADYLVHIRLDRNMSVPSIKGVRAALGQIAWLKGIDLGGSRQLSLLIKSFEQSCPPHSLKAPEWDVLLVLDSLKKPPFEPLRQALDREFTLKTVFLLALASSKRVGELHRLATNVSHSIGWKEAILTFVPSFVAETQNPAVSDLRFSEVVIPAINKSDDSEDLQLCPVRGLRKYLASTSRLRPAMKNLFVFTGKVRKAISKNTISNWLKEVIQRVYIAKGRPAPSSAKPHDIRSISTSMAFSKNISVAQVLKAVLWKRQNTFISHYLKDCSLVSRDEYRLGPIVVAQQMI
ncbi:uncharacterized protein [Palaemon carinicauda]|uniref:uncharacterized protein n=1 Tax=Palaemon carinicauda TaxID=392227 RepID=UPI0035B66E95